MTVNFLILIIGSIGGFLLLQKIPKLHKRKKDLPKLKISIVIPARNEEKTLSLLLDDLKKQCRVIIHVLQKQAQKRISNYN